MTDRRKPPLRTRLCDLLGCEQPAFGLAGPVLNGTSQNGFKVMT